MRDDIKDRLDKAQTIQQQIKKLELEHQEHREFILAYMVAAEIEKIETPSVTVSVRSRIDWQFSKALENEIFRINLDKKFEIQQGIAQTKKKTTYIQMKTKEQS